MGDYVLANFGSLGEGEASFAQAYNGLTSTVSDLQGQLQSHLSSWEGSAQAAYHEAQAIWNQAIADMGQVISAMSSVIGTANENYQNAERTNSGMF
jgi:early secretory antigenic target protein ESAT-6